jgi:hypothetical protein
MVHRQFAGGDLLADAKHCPLFIFTLSSIYGMKQQALVSVAKVTKHFETPLDYAGAVIADPALSESRLTRLVQDNNFRASSSKGKTRMASLRFPRFC